MSEQNGAARFRAAADAFRTHMRSQSDSAIACGRQANLDALIKSMTIISENQLAQFEAHLTTLSALLGAATENGDPDAVLGEVVQTIDDAMTRSASANTHLLDIIANAMEEAMEGGELPEAKPSGEEQQR